MSRILILAFLLPTGVLAAQSYPNDGVTQSAWFAYVGDHTFARKPDEGKWGLHLEGQLRRSPFVANSQQLLLRPGLFRKVAESQRITVGYTYVRNSPPANSATILGVEPRHTAYTQYDRDDKLGRIKLKQSARLENTFAGSRRGHVVSGPPAEQWNRSRTKSLDSVHHQFRQEPAGFISVEMNPAGYCVSATISFNSASAAFGRVRLMA